MQRSEQFGDGLSRQRVLQVGSDVTQGLQHKASFRHMGVRQYQAFVRNDRTAMEQQVEVDPPRPLAGRAGAPEEYSLDPEKPLKQFVGGKCRVKPQDSVVEQWLVGDAYG